jgi:hypothetical protein
LDCSFKNVGGSSGAWSLSTGWQERRSLDWCWIEWRGWVGLLHAWEQLKKRKARWSGCWCGCIMFERIVVVLCSGYEKYSCLWWWWWWWWWWWCVYCFWCKLFPYFILSYMANSSYFVSPV